MLCQLWRQCKKWLPSFTTKISICRSMVVHYQTWLSFVYKNLPMQNSILSQRNIKTYWQFFDKTSFLVQLSFLHSNQLLMNFLFKSLQTYANLLLGFLQANYTPARCVNPCPLVFIRVGISIQKPVDSNHYHKRPVVSKDGHVLFSTNKTWL